MSAPLLIISMTRSSRTLHVKMMNGVVFTDALHCFEERLGLGNHG